MPAACPAMAAPMATSGLLCAARIATAIASIDASCACPCLFTMRARWRWVTWEISCASTEASSDSDSAARINPVCTPI